MNLAEQAFARARIEANGQPADDGAADDGAPVWKPPLPLDTAPAIPAFPLEVLPPALRGFVGEVAKATNSPPDYCAAPMLAVAGGAVGNAVRLSITSSHPQPACLFVAVVGRPGTGKTPPLEILLAPLHAAERRSYVEWRRRKDAWEEGDSGSRGAKPSMRRYLADNATVEGICRVLADNQRGLLMARDELAALFTGMNQYKAGGKGSDRQCFLSFWSGSTIIIDRQKQEGVPLTVRRPFVGIVGNIQPDVLRGFKADKTPDDGMFDRFVFSYPQELPATGERWLRVPDESLRMWEKVADRLLALEGNKRPDGDEWPRLVPLSNDACRAWEILTDAHADEVNDPDFADHLRGPWAKLVPGYAGRLALIIQLLWWASEEGEIEPVSAASVEAAGLLIGYFKANAIKVRAAAYVTETAAGAGRILRWLADRSDLKSFSRRDLGHDLRHSFPEPNDLDKPLEMLCEHGFIVEDPNQAYQGTGRKPTARYLVNPHMGAKGSKGSKGGA
jgi:hypothetical protein